jgi:methionyl-tRNA formyltransferase
VRRLHIDVVVVMNFDQILRDGFIHSPRSGVINVHPSLLPSLRGPCPALWALLERRPEVGVTIHVIENTEIDAGPIVAQQAMAADFQQSVGELTSALFLAGVGLIKNVTDRLVQGWDPCTHGRAGMDSEYRGFPSRTQMAEAVARRVRLCRLTHVSSLMWAAAGLPFPGSR